MHVHKEYWEGIVKLSSQILVYLFIKRMQHTFSFVLPVCLSLNTSQILTPWYVLDIYETVGED